MCRIFLIIGHSQLQQSQAQILHHYDAHLLDFQPGQVGKIEKPPARMPDKARVTNKAETKTGNIHRSLRYRDPSGQVIVFSKDRKGSLRRQSAPPAPTTPRIAKVTPKSVPKLTPRSISEAPLQRISRAAPKSVPKIASKGRPSAKKEERKPTAKREERKPTPKREERKLTPKRGEKEAHAEEGGKETHSEEGGKETHSKNETKERRLQLRRTEGKLKCQAREPRDGQAF